jgi:hypothetical protein
MKIILLMTLVVLSSSCAKSVKEVKSSGFLSDYSRMEKVDENTMKYRSDKLSNYSKFIIEPIELKLIKTKENNAADEFTDKELDELKEFLKSNLMKYLDAEESVSVVTTAGPNVGRLKIAITDVKKTIGALNLTIYTKITGAGLGGVAVEGEILDSISGEQLGATAKWGSGSRILRAGYTKTGDAKILLKKWSKELAKNLSHNEE